MVFMSHPSVSIVGQRSRPLPPATFGRTVTHIGIRDLIERTIMRFLTRSSLVSAACGMLALSLGAPASAVNCYQVWDARENLVYQSISPPFDLARPGFDRAMANLRSQRRTFIFFDTPDCAITGSSLTGPDSVAASSDPASLLDIRSTSPGYGRGGGGMLSPTPAAAGPSAPAGAPAPATTNVRPSAPPGPGTTRSSVF
jgi:hypothetical protein